MIPKIGGLAVSPVSARRIGWARSTSFTPSSPASWRHTAFELGLRPGLEARQASEEPVQPGPEGRRQELAGGGRVVARRILEVEPRLRHDLGQRVRSRRQVDDGGLDQEHSRILDSGPLQVS